MIAPNADIRRLLPEDATDYRGIRLRALRTTPEAFSSTYEVESERPVEAFADRLATSRVFGAYQSSSIVGMIGLLPESGAKLGHKALIWGFFVDPCERGRGTGALLMEAALKEAGSVVEQVMLTVVADNVAAIRLYERFGFRRYGTEPRALKTPDGYVDEALMALIFDRT